MGYCLGVDLGTTFVAAAVAHDERLDMVPLSDRSVVMPAAVYVRDDGLLLTGDAAARRIVSNPDRVASEIKRRLGDPTPLMLGGSAYQVTDLLGTLLRDVLTKVAADQGGPPDAVVLTHPANWGPYRRELFEEVPRSAGVEDARSVTEPEAAAAYYAATHPMAVGDIVAVYDFGGGTFDATVLGRTESGLDVLGAPEGIERLGGADIDEAVLSFVNHAVGGAVTDLDLGDANAVVALARLRQDCILAKEALSLDTETVIPVFLPGQHRDVPLTRSQFEGLIAPQVQSTIGTLSRALRSAGIPPSRLSAVLLVGGSSRIPLVARMIGEQLGCRPVVEARPKHPVALGAATVARCAGFFPEPVEAVDPPEVPGSPRKPSAAPGELPTGPMAAADALPAQRGPGAGGDSGGEHRTVSGPALPVAAAPPVSGGSSAPPGAGIRTGDAETITGLPAAVPPAAPEVADADTLVVPGVPPDGRTPGGRPPGSGALPGPAAPPDGGRGGPPGPGTPGGSASSDGRAPPGGRRRGRRWPKDRRGKLTLVGVLCVLVIAVVVAVLTGPRLLGAAGDRSPAAPSTEVPTPAGAAIPSTAPAAAVPVPSLGTAIPVGPTPNFVAATPNGRQLYVANAGAGTITVVDTAVDKVTATIKVPAGPPQYLAFSPDGKRIYVSVWNDARTITALSIVDATRNTVVNTIPMASRPFVPAVSPDGAKVYVPNHDTGNISIIDTRTDTKLSDVTVPKNPHWVSFTPDGKRVYVADHESNVVSVVDTATDKVLATVPVGASPHSVAVHPARPLVANVNYDSASVTVIDTNTNQVVATVPVGRNPQDVVWSADGRFAYVANNADNSVSVIDASTFTVTATIPTGASPTSIAVLPNGETAYVSDHDAGTLTVLDVGS